MREVLDRNKLPNDVEALKDLFISTVLCLVSTIEHLETRLAAQEGAHEQSPEEPNEQPSKTVRERCLGSGDKWRTANRSQLLPLTHPLSPDSLLVRVDALAEDVQHCGSCGAFLSKVSDELEELLKTDPEHVVEELPDPSPCQDCLVIKITTIGSVLYLRCPLYVLGSQMPAVN